MEHLEEASIILARGDAALVIRASGELESYIPGVRDDDPVTDNALIIIALAGTVTNPDELNRLVEKYVYGAIERMKEERE